MEEAGMCSVTRCLGWAAAILILNAISVRAEDERQANAYEMTVLVSDLTGAANTDPLLQNAWGVAFTPGASPFWVADNATGCATLYDGVGVPQPTSKPLQVKIPLPGNVVPATACKSIDPKHPSNPTPAAPTGMVWNPTSTFLVPNTTIPATFIWATEDGTIAAWAATLSDTSHAVEAVNNSPNAVYKGLVFGTNSHGVFLFATDFRGGKIDVFAGNGSSGFRPATQTEISGTFGDPDLPTGFAPFGIQNINGNLFVTYALQDAQKHDDVAAPGNGFVDVYDTDGNLLQRFASRRSLNSPWGVTRASFAFGRFSGDILIGNFGDGQINAFDSNGKFRGTLSSKRGKPLKIDGLWTLTLGGGRNSNSDVLYFTAGPNGERDGQFGTIIPASELTGDRVMLNRREPVQ
jgi:uncharacterized protein (TIGR03118 family)